MIPELATLPTIRQLDRHAWLSRISPIPNVVWHGRFWPGWFENTRRLVDHELVIVLEGTCRIEVADDSYDLDTGSWIIIPPDTPHSTLSAPDQSLRRYCVHFDWLYAGDHRTPRQWVFAPEQLSPDDIRPAPEWLPQERLQGRADMELVEDTLHRLTESWTSADARRHATCRGILLELLAILLTPASPTKASEPDRELAQNVRQLLENPDIVHGDSIQSMLETLGLSYAHLCRVFQRHFGVAPGRYINMLRIERAKRLLSDESIAIAAIATEVGFNSPQYFTRTFRRFTGLSPREYRSHLTPANRS